MRRWEAKPIEKVNLGLKGLSAVYKEASKYEIVIFGFKLMVYGVVDMPEFIGSFFFYHLK